MTTPDGTISSEASSKPRRRIAWPRLHRSTWVVLAVALAALGYIAGTGELLDDFEDASGSLAVYEHGWPWTFAYRFYSDDNQPTPPVSHEFSAFDGGRLTADVAAVLLLAVVIAAAWQWRRRRRGGAWQFSLREALLAVTLVAVALSWWKWHHGIALEEARLDELRQRQSGEWEGTDPPDAATPTDADALAAAEDAANRAAQAKPRQPLEIHAWRRTEPLFLSRLLPRRWLRDFTHVSACSVGDFKQADPRFAEHLAGYWRSVPYCTILRVHYCTLPASALAALGRLPRLRSLAIDTVDVKADDSGDARWEYGESLRALDIQNCEHLPEEAISAIARAEGLEEVGFWGVPVHDSDLACFRRLQHLRRLRLDPSFLTDGAMSQLGSLSALRSLTLVGDELGDEAVQSIVRLDQIEELDVGDIILPKEHLPALLGMKNLRSLRVSSREPIQTEGGLSLIIGLQKVAHPIHRPAPGSLEEIETALYDEQIRFDQLRSVERCTLDDCDCHARLPQWVRTWLYLYRPDNESWYPVSVLGGMGMGMM